MLRIRLSVLLPTGALAVAMACLAVVLASQRPAEASFPGRNGLMAFAYGGYCSIFASTDESQIFTSRLDGSSPKQRTNADGCSTEPSWSPDGTKIAFASNRDGQDYEIYVKDITTGEVSQITNNTEPDRNPSWAPDGSKIVFQKYSAPRDPACDDDSRFYPDIAVIDADGSNEKQLTEGCDYGFSPKWSPDGSKIAFYSSKCETCDNPPFDIMTMNPDGSELTNLTRSTLSVEFDFDWKPNGKKIVYERRPQDLESANIWKMSADGSHKDRLTFGTQAIDTNPIWSPNGRKILFGRYCSGCDTQGFMTMNVDGTNKTNVPGLLNYGDWQPVPTP